MRYKFASSSQNTFMSPKIISIIFSMILLAVFVYDLQAQSFNGFSVSNATIDKDDIFSGGPPRDGIPSIDQPKFIDIEKVNFLDDGDIVIGLVRGDIARAYPIRILIWHEIVNDVIAGDAVVVTYCPLCGTSMVFSRNINGKLRTFGVSGLLYQSDVLMYDRESESLWSQLAMKSVSGASVGTELNWLPSEHLTWKAWREKYPHGKVLSKDTGHRRNYGGDAYASYFASDRTMFPVPHKRKELPNKSWVVGVVIDGKAKAYPIADLPTKQTIEDKMGDKQLFVRHIANEKYTQITDENGEPIPSVMAFWFAWQAFYPKTDLWQQR